MTAAQSVDSREPLEESGGATAHSYGALALVLIALALRIVEYLHNKAIWLDEAHLALNILQRGYAGLTERLDAGQGAPPARLQIGCASSASIQLDGDEI